MIYYMLNKNTKMSMHMVNKKQQLNQRADINQLKCLIYPATAWNLEYKVEYAVDEYSKPLTSLFIILYDKKLLGLSLGPLLY